MSARTFSLGKTKKFGNIAVEVVVENAESIERVYLHGNMIVKINHTTRKVLVNNCGWPTMTTHRAMNNALRQIGCKVSVFKSKGEAMVMLGNGERKSFIESGCVFDF